MQLKLKRLTVQCDLQYFQLWLMFVLQSSLCLAELCLIMGFMGQKCFHEVILIKANLHSARAAIEQQIQYQCVNTVHNLKMVFY